MFTFLLVIYISAYVFFFRLDTCKRIWAKDFCFKNDHFHIDWPCCPPLKTMTDRVLCWKIRTWLTTKLNKLLRLHINQQYYTEWNSFLILDYNHMLFSVFLFFSKVIFRNHSNWWTFIRISKHARIISLKSFEMYQIKIRDWLI